MLHYTALKKKKPGLRVAYTLIKLLTPIQIIMSKKIHTIQAGTSFAHFESKLVEYLVSPVSNRT